MGLLSPDANRAGSVDMMELNRILSEDENKRTRTYSTTFSVLFYVFMSIFWALIQVLTSVRVKYIRKNFLLIYILFLGINVVFKYLLKLISMKLDEIRAKKEDSKCHYISIELFVEWYCSFVYWFWLRFMIAYITPDFYQFIEAIAIHFATESYKTTFCASKFYYRITSKFGFKYGEKYKYNKFCTKLL